MANVYRPAQPNSLAALLASSINAPEYGNAPPEPPQPSMASGSENEILTPQMRNSLLEQLLQPDVGPAPVDDSPSRGQVVGASFVDALNNIASIYSGANVRSNFFNQTQNRLEQNRAEKSRYADRKALAEGQVRREKLNYLIGSSDRAQSREDAQLAAKDLKQLTLASQLADRRERERVRVEERAQKLADVEAANAVEQQRAQRDHLWDEQMARLNNQLKDPEDKGAEKKKKSIQEGIDIINQTANAMPGILQDGWVNDKGVPQKAQTPEQIKTMVRRELNRLALDRETYDLLNLYYDKEVESQIEDARRNLMIPGGGP